MPRTLCQQLRSPSILLLQDLCLAPSLGTLAEPVCPRVPLKLDQRGAVKRLWLALVRGLCPQQLHCLHSLKALGRNGHQAGLGNKRTRGCLHTTALAAARASLTRTRSVSTIATWTSSGLTLLNRLCPMDCPTTEKAFGERGPWGQFQKAPSLLRGHACVVLVWGRMTRPVHTSVHAPEMSPVIPGEQKGQLQKRCGRLEAHVKG